MRWHAIVSAAVPRTLLVVSSPPKRSTAVNIRLARTQSLSRDKSLAPGVHAD